MYCIHFDCITIAVKILTSVLMFTNGIEFLRAIFVGLGVSSLHEYILYFLTLHNVVLCSSWFLTVALLPWQPHVFPASWSINSLWTHGMFERFTDGGWHNLFRTSSDGRSSLLEQITWVLVTQWLEKLSVKN